MESFFDILDYNAYKYSRFKCTSLVIGNQTKKKKEKKTYRWSQRNVTTTPFQSLHTSCSLLLSTLMKQHHYAIHHASVSVIIGFSPDSIIFAMSSSSTTFRSVSEARPRSNNHAFVITNVVTTSMTLQFSADVSHNPSLPHLYSTIINHSTHFVKVHVLSANSSTGTCQRTMLQM
jgi:hypothetical protein